LTKKDCTWNWGVEQQNAFEALKKAFTTAPVLRIPNDEDPFKLSTDASDFATGAVLSQKDMQTNLWHPVAFFSKSLDVHERNYENERKKRRNNSLQRTYSTTMIIASTPRTSVVDIYESPLVQINLSIPKWVKTAVHTLIERFIDKDRLPSEIWRAETQEV